VVALLARLEDAVAAVRHHLGAAAKGPQLDPGVRLERKEEDLPVELRKLPTSGRPRRSNGWELPGPGLMSVSRAVPAPVPSLFHSSSPCAGSLAKKKRVPFTFVRSPGSESLAVGSGSMGLGLMSFTRTVPSGVPSVFQSSRPVIPSSAAKNRVPFTSAMLCG